MKKFAGILVVTGLCLILAVICVVQPWKLRWNMEPHVENLTESAKILQNPNRGFYHIYGVLLSDDAQDVKNDFQAKMKNDTESTLALMEINLYNYRDREISPKGLEQLQKVFAAMAEKKKTWVVRFPYDWGDWTEAFEPDRLDLILTHIKQTAPVLQTYADHIFIVQGLFTGSSGEMHDTSYGDADSMRKLAQQMAACTDETTYLSVRTPKQWRTITKTEDASDQTTELTKRMGLYNDGMLGSDSDLGTYGEQSKKEAGIYGAWNRAEELAFQDTLCAHVPNGGEVVLDNEYNDIENAVDDMKTMHITYINRDYDADVMDKWASLIIHTDDCFGGMDGLSYVESHLGYRPVLSDPKMTYDLWKVTLHVELSIKNVGFAPVYKACVGVWTIKNEKDEVLYRQKMTENVAALTGGNQENVTLTVNGDFCLRGENVKNCSVYFSLKDQAEDKMITFGNEQEETKDGYLIGTFSSKKEKESE